MDKHTLLVVEDDPQASQMLQLYLESEGFLVAVAKDGPSGETLFHQVSPSMVILDIMLPGFDGMELCLRIRTSSIIPIIIPVFQIVKKTGAKENIFY